MLGNHGSRVREEDAREDYHDPTAGIAGAAPARSALTLRLILAVFGLVVCAVGAALFLVMVSQPADRRGARFPRGRRGRRYCRGRPPQAAGGARLETGDRDTARERRPWQPALPSRRCRHRGSDRHRRCDRRRTARRSRSPAGAIRQRAHTAAARPSRRRRGPRRPGRGARPAGLSCGAARVW